MSNRRKLVITLGASAFAGPLSSLAQVPAAKLARIGLMGPGSVASGTSWAPALVANLRDLGYARTGQRMAAELLGADKWSDCRFKPGELGEAGPR